MRLSTLLVLVPLGAALSAACSSTPDDPPPAGTTPPSITPPAPTSPVTPPGPGEPTDIAFGAGAKFAARDCGVTLRWEGGGTDVKVGGEMNAWQPQATTRVDGRPALRVEPSPALQPGKLYGYKFVVDGNWVVDPAAERRKIVGGILNSAFRMPTCEAGPEITTGKLEATPAGEAKLRVTFATAKDGSRIKRVLASLDRGPLPARSFTVDDAAGAVDLSFSALPKGKHRVTVVAEDEAGRKAEPVELPFWVEAEAFDYSDGVLYMLMIDRFANGDRSNDKPIGAPVEYDADWHGGDLGGALAVMKTGYFDKLGVRTIWISPVNAQTDKHEPGDGGYRYSAYHGYWPVKAREVEPRYGGDAALKAFVAEAHARGIRVLVDLINNQVHEDHEYVKPHASWFRRACKCGDDANGCGWSQRPFDCLFQPYLPDIDWTKDDAQDRFIADAEHWISEMDLDGFRVDAVKHVEPTSIYNLRAALKRRFEQGGARVFMVGETAVGENDSGTFFGERYDNGYQWIDAYTGPTALDGQFDFPTRHNMADGLVNGLKPLNEVEGELAKAESRYKKGARHVRFLNGHDNPRIASIAARDPKLGCAWANGCRGDQLPPLAYSDADVYTRLERALTVLYTLPGIPYLYAGDEVAFGGGPDPDMRRDMLFEEPALAGLRMARPGGTPPALTAQQIGLRDWARKLGAARASSKALRRGERVTLIGNEGDLWVYAYQAGPKEIAIVAINRGGAVSRSVPTTGLDLSGVASFRAALDRGTVTAAGGALTLTLGAGQAGLFLAQ